MANVVATAADVQTAPIPMEDASLEIRDSAVDVENIMARIRRSISEKKKAFNYREDVLLAQGIDALQLTRSGKSIADHISLLKYTARMDLEGEQISSHRPLMGFAIKWAKRLTRFWIRKYTDSIFTKQNHFNSEMISVLSELNHHLEQLKGENERLRQQLEVQSRR